MKFSEITPRLAQIPKNQLFTPVASAELSSLVTELDTSADELKAVGSPFHQATKVMASNILSVANALEDNSATMSMMLDLRHRMLAYDNLLEDIELSFAQCQQSKGNKAYALEVSALAKALKNVKAPSGALPKHQSGKVDDDQWDAKDDATSIQVDVELVLHDLAAKNKELISQLPRSTVKTYAVVKLPVVLAVSPYPNRQKLERLGFDVIDYEGYPVFQDQVLLAIRASYAREWDMDISELAAEIVQIINHSANTKLMLVSDVGRTVPHSPGFSYFWVMPANYLSKLTPVINTLDEWSVPVASL